MGRKFSEENSLANKYPELLKEWHTTENTGFSPEKLSYGSHKKITWICHLNHIWKATIKSRTLCKTKCPYCTHQLASPEYCIASIRPKWIDEIHPTKNGNLNAYNLCPYSNKSVYFICKNSHEWVETPNQRMSYKECRYCSNEAPHKDYCLATHFPQLAKEWDYDKNDITPYDIMPSSHIMVWWKCSAGHCFQTSCHLRHKGSQIFACYQCKQKSNGERKIADFLDVKHIKYIREYRFKDCKNKVRLPFDFAVFIDDKMFTIEYQGLQHYKPKGFGSTKNLQDQFNNLTNNDQIKRSYCNDNKIPHLEIPYWNFDKIEKLVSEFLELEMVGK